MLILARGSLDWSRRWVRRRPEGRMCVRFSFMCMQKNKNKKSKEPERWQQQHCWNYKIDDTHPYTHSRSDYTNLKVPCRFRGSFIAGGWTKKVCFMVGYGVCTPTLITTLPIQWQRYKGWMLQRERACCCCWLLIVACRRQMLLAVVKMNETGDVSDDVLLDNWQ